MNFRAEQPEQKGVIFNIQRYSVHDGPGIRTTVFLKGCPLRCGWCHNPEGLESQPQVVIYDGCIDCGRCRLICPACKSPLAAEADETKTITCGHCWTCIPPCPTGSRRVIGREMTETEVMTEVLKDRIFYSDSGGGVTFSGGEPLSQAPFVRKLLSRCREQDIHTAVDTSGFGSQEDLLSLAELAGLFLFDLKLMDDEKHKQYTGVSNRTILENLTALAKVHRNIWLRVPIIPSITDEPSNLDAIADLAATLPAVRQVCLLPYHKTAAAKFKRLGKPYPLENIEQPNPEYMESLRQRFAARGLAVSIGG